MRERCCRNDVDYLFKRQALELPEGGGSASATG